MSYPTTYRGGIGPQKLPPWRPPGGGIPRAAAGIPPWVRGAATIGLGLSIVGLAYQFYQIYQSYQVTSSFVPVAGSINIDCGPQASPLFKLTPWADCVTTGAIGMNQQGISITGTYPNRIYSGSWFRDGNVVAGTGLWFGRLAKQFRYQEAVHGVRTPYPVVFGAAMPNKWTKALPMRSFADPRYTPYEIADGIPENRGTRHTFVIAGSLIRGRGGVEVTTIGPENREPPKRNEKEKKTRNKLTRLAWTGFTAIAAFSEINDLVDVLYKSLPEQYRMSKRNYLQRGKQVLNHWEEIDVETALVEYIKNEIEDRLVGGAFGGARKQANRLTGDEWLFKQLQTELSQFGNEKQRASWKNGKTKQARSSQN